MTMTFHTRPQKHNTLICLENPDQVLEEPNPAGWVLVLVGTCLSRRSVRRTELGSPPAAAWLMETEAETGLC